MQKFSVDQKRITLEKFLLLVSDLSRSQILKYIKANKVSINDISTTERNQLVSIGDIISLDDSISENLNLSIDTEMNIPILYEDAEIYIVDKPNGLVVHEGAGNKFGLIDILAQKYSLPNPKIVNRIDKETSGLMVVTKDAKYHKYYAEQFEKRSVKKQYICIVSRAFQSIFRKYQSEFLSFGGYISRSDRDRKIMYFEAEDIHKEPVSDKDLLQILKTNKRKERYALTEFQKFDNVEFDSNIALLVTLRTGRTHQIRATLKSLGFPILGDTAYNGENYKRLMLHSYKIELLNKNGETLSLMSNLPEDFKPFTEN